ncbi:MAG: Glucosamine-6-phosphate deaminase [Verrucomicrobiota bacterium]|jgi:glucosamine-6-phosphate deaminase
MEIIIKPDAVGAQQEAARIIANQVRRKPDSVLGLATGSTPVPIYALLVEEHRRGRLDFARVRTFNLDEYVGLGPEHPASYRWFMQEHLFGKVNLAPGHVRVPDGLARDIPAHCAEYEAAIAGAGGLDLQLLGIGRDGHIGFNEPSSSLSSRTRIKTITPQTVADNARFFASAAEVPRHVITMGVGTIQEARRCLLVATGEGKAPVVARMIEGSISSDCPATILQMHPCCTVVLDEAAAARLQRAEYYRWIYDNKPAWQRE